MNSIPPSLERFGPMLQAAIDRQIRSGSASRARLVTSTARWRLAGVGVTALALVAVLVTSGALGGGPFVQRAAAAQAAAVLQDVPAGAVMHIHTLGSQPNPDGTVVSWENESWRSTSAPFAGRGIERSPDSPTVESGFDATGRAFLFDATTNTVFESASGDAATFSSPDEGFRAEAIAMLTSGDARIDGHEAVDGRDALRIVSADGHAAYLVDPVTYDPIEWRTTGDGGSSTLRFEAYEVLPGTAANLSLLDLRAQHPSAHVDTDPANYREAMARLYPHG